jgi:hypothetical protein
MHQLAVGSWQSVVGGSNTYHGMEIYRKLKIIYASVSFVHYFNIMKILKIIGT